MEYLPNAPCAAKAAGEQVAVDPLVPLGVAGGVGLLVLRLEDADDLAVGVARKVAAGAALRDHARVHALVDGGTHAVDNCLELGLGDDRVWHVARVGRARRRARERLGRRGAHALGRLEDRVVDLEALLVLVAALLLVPLELGRDLVGPALEARVDGLEVDARVGTVAPRGRRGVVVAVRGATRVRRGRRIHRRGRSHAARRMRAYGHGHRRGRQAHGALIVVGVVGEAVGLGESFVARRGRAWPGHRGQRRERGEASTVMVVRGVVHGCIVGW